MDSQAIYKGLNDVCEIKLKLPGTDTNLLTHFVVCSHFKLVSQDCSKKHVYLEWNGILTVRYFLISSFITFRKYVFLSFIPNI